MKRLCIVAVDIRSAHNVGSLFRSADGFSAEVVLVGITPRPKGAPDEDRLPHIAAKADRAIHKTALGAESSVTWRYFSAWEQAADTLQAEGYLLAAIEQDPRSIPLPQMADKDLALVLGAEVEGLPAPILDRCDAIHEIPMGGSKESLNVSVAGSIALYEARRKNDITMVE